MSCRYTRGKFEPMAIRTYGFQKVSGDDMKDIISRLQKPTHSTESGGYFPEGYFKQPQHRPPVYPICKRAPPSEDGRIGSGLRRGMSPKLMTRMVRRMQKPTISRLAATGAITPDHEIPPPQYRERPQTAEEKEKLMYRLSRSTVASRRKDTDTYWGDVLESDSYNSEGIYENDQPVDDDTLSDIVVRMRTPTVASEKGADGNTCPRFRSNRPHINRDRLPLVSGLAKSRTVDEIVERLHRPSSGASQGRHGFTSESTAVYPQHCGCSRSTLSR